MRISAAAHFASAGPSEGTMETVAKVVTVPFGGAGIV